MRAEQLQDQRSVIMSTPSANPIHRILFATDFSPASAAAFDYAERLAAATGAELLAVHALGIGDFWGGGGKEQNDKETRQKLEATESSLPGVQIEHITHEGRPGDVICWLAQDRACDLIVMGTHGLTGFAHLVLGSVAEHVVRNARCPVMTVRLPSKKDQPLEEPRDFPPIPPIM